MAGIDIGKLQVSPDNAGKFREWIRTRGGLLVWRSADLSDPAASMTTPALTTDGKPYPSPGWKFPGPAERHITSEQDIEVCSDNEVKRFRVRVKQQGWGRTVVSDTGSERIRKEVAKAGTGSYHTFDYETQEAVIMRPATVVPLSEWNVTPTPKGWGSVDGGPELGGEG